MNWLEFLASLVSSVVWPAVVLITIRLFREPLSELVRSLKRLSYKDLAMDFQMGVDNVQAEVKAVLPALAGNGKGDAVDDERDALQRVAGLVPRAAVLAAWQELEQKIRSARERAEVPVGPLRSNDIRTVLNALERSSVLDPSEVRVLHQLRNLRNVAAHAPQGEEISADAALEYVDMAYRVGKRLELIAG